MNVLDIILLPFVFIYRGFISVILLPYYFVIGIGKVFGIGNKKKKMTISEVKPGEKVKIIKETRSAYSTPKTPQKETDPVKIAETKKRDTLKKQKDFEKLVAKARAEEERRVK